MLRKSNQKIYTIINSEVLQNYDKYIYVPLIYNLFHMKKKLLKFLPVNFIIIKSVNLYC